MHSKNCRLQIANRKLKNLKPKVPKKPCLVTLNHALNQVQGLRFQGLVSSRFCEMLNRVQHDMFVIS